MVSVLWQYVLHIVQHLLIAVLSNNDMIKNINLWTCQQHCGIIGDQVIHGVGQRVTEGSGRVRGAVGFVAITQYSDCIGNTIADSSHTG